MRIGVEATCWNNRRGYGRHLRSLLTAVFDIDQQNEYKLFVDTPIDDPHPLPSRCTIVHVPAKVPALKAARADGRRSIADVWSMSRVLSQAKLDYLIFPTPYTYVPVFTTATKLLVIHDAIAERLPDYVFPNRKGRALWQLKSTLARMQADWVVTVSEFSRRALIKDFGLDPDRVRVVGEAPDPIFQRLVDSPMLPALTARGVTDKNQIVTYVGGFGPHKNLPTLLDAFESLVQSHFPDAVLILAGDYLSDPFYSHFPELKQRLDRGALAQSVVLTGFLPDPDLVKLLNCSSLLVLPSLMEGFGLPAVEAAACGVPVVATRESPLPELLGAGMLAIDPHDTDDLREAIAIVLGDGGLRQRMSQGALNAAQALSWRREATELLTLLDEMSGKYDLT